MRNVDDAWKYEPRLPKAIAALDDRTVPLDGHTWAEVLVPFISSLFIRGPEFGDRYHYYRDKLPDLEEFIPGFKYKDNANGGRLSEWQKIIAPVMSARWTVLHGSGEPVVITNDIGYCVSAPESGQYAFPISPSSILVLERCMTRPILDWNGQQWTAPIEHHDVTDDELILYRQAMQDHAVKEVYGPTEEAVVFPTPDFQPHVRPVGPRDLFPQPNWGSMMIPYLHDHFRVLTLIHSSPMEYVKTLTTASQGFDWQLIRRVWSTFAFVGGRPQFVGGLAYNSVSVCLDLGRFTMEDVEAWRKIPLTVP
jgi:hypothetical protein